MRVLFVPRGDAGQIFGGDVVQMRKTMVALERLGVEIAVGPAARARDELFDVVHLWTSLHTPAPLLEQLDALAPVRERTRVVHSTIWAPHHVVRWMDAARRWLFAVHPNGATITLETARHELERIAERSLDFTVDGQKLAAFAPHPFTPECRAVLARVDAILPNSWMELQAIFTFLGDFCAYGVVPNAADAQDFASGDPSRLPAELAATPYAMMCARFDTRKQQDFAMLAVKTLNVPMVFVGEQTDREIFERVKAIGSGARAPVYYVPFLPQEKLRDFYAGARVHLLPSIFESPGLSSIEAALADCAIVTGNLAFESEYFREDAYYCDPCNAFSIAAAVERAWNDYAATGERRARLRERIRTDYTWDAAARATLIAYKNILA